MKAFFKGIVFFLFVNLSFAQGWLPQGARSMGLANSSVVLDDVFAFHHNPGALAFLPNIAAGVHYETRFMLRELQTQSFAVVIPNNSGSFSFGGQFYGYENFRTSRIGGGYSLKLSPTLALGVQLNYLNLRLDTYYGVRHGVSAEVGILAKVNEKLTLGGSVINIGNTRVSTITDERFGTLIRFGASYKLMDDLSLIGELSQSMQYPLVVKGGMEYVLKDKFFIRAGISNKPINLSFGWGVKWKNIQLDMGSQYHTTVGWTPGLSFVYSFQKNQVE